MNDKFVQMKGPFAAKEDIIADIKSLYDPDFLYVKKCGIQAEKTHQVSVNGATCEMGKTDILEYNDVKITSLYFLQDEPASTLVDCILE